MERQVAVVGYGRWSAIRENLACALHVRGLTDADVTFFTDWPELGPLLEDRGVSVCPEVLPVPQERGSETAHGSKTRFFSIKPRLYRLLPRAHNLFLDGDAVPVDRFDEVWEFVERPGTPGVALCRDRYPTTMATWARAVRPLGPDEEWEYMRRTGSLGIRVPTYNTGVMAWRRGPAVEELFDEWSREWERFGCGNQQALSRVVHARPDLAALVLEMPLRFNTFVMRGDQLKLPRYADVLIPHGHQAAKRTFVKAWKEAEPLMEAAGLHKGMEPRT